MRRDPILCWLAFAAFICALVIAFLLVTPHRSGNGPLSVVDRFRPGLQTHPAPD